MKLSTLIIPFGTCVSAIDIGNQVISFDPAEDNLLLAGKGTAPVINVASNEFAGVVRAAGDLALDFGRVTGINGTLKQNDTVIETDKYSLIIVGTIGSSNIIDELVQSKKINLSRITGKWESYIQAYVDNPSDGIDSALVIAGSDVRGTIYGLYDISETIGVSPWYFWADVPPKKRSAIYATKKIKIQGPPSVKYRGLFINDEGPCLTGWVSGNFPQGSGGNSFTSLFYELVFELILRLKGNLLWPAMSREQMFYVDDVDNGVVADRYSVFMGTSHTEPMTRSSHEQTKFLSGAWDWSTNSANVTKFMEQGANCAKNWSTLFTLGMRGSGDRPAENMSPTSLEEIIDTQQALLENAIGKDISDIPQLWSLYKEVGWYWQAGMNISEFVTLLWTDDNFGNLMRVPYPNETSRAAGAGVYYHFQYVGAPRDYNCINTIQLVKTWEQMHFAYERDARQVWIANVGDIKPLEVPLSHFMDMAYDMSKFTTPKSTSSWIKSWAAKQFGSSVAATTDSILTTYGILIMRRKYELLSQTPFAFSTSNCEEAARNLQDWASLLDLAQAVYDSLDDAAQPSFFEMILHPVLAGKTMIELYTRTAQAASYKQQLRTSTNRMASNARAAYAMDANITATYSTLLGGKWDHMMDQVHTGYTDAKHYAPSKNVIPKISYIDDSTVPKSGSLGISFEGLNGSLPGEGSSVLLPVDPYMPPEEQRWLDIFTRTNTTFSYKISTNTSYVSISNSTGTLHAQGGISDVRCLITIDWANAPSGLAYAAMSVTQVDEAANRTFVTLPINNPKSPPKGSGFIESKGVVSMEAAHYAQADSRGGVEYIEIPGYGRTVSAIKLWPVTAESQSPSDGPRLSYKFYTHSAESKAQLLFYLGETGNLDPRRPLLYAYSIDGASPVTVQPIPDYAMGTNPADWNSTVITGARVSTQNVSISQGSHELLLWLLEPGVLIQKIVLDLGGVRESALGPPESWRI